MRGNQVDGQTVGISGGTLAPSAWTSLGQLILQLWNLAGARLAGAGLGLSSQILLARAFPKSDVGMAFLAMSATAAVSLIMTAGYPALSVTYLARYYTLGRRSMIDAFHAAARQDTLFASALTLAVIGLAVYLVPLDAETRTAMLFGCLGAIPYAVMRLNNSAANALKRFTLSYVPDFVFRPLILLVFIIAMMVFQPGFSMTTVLWAFVVIAVGVGAVQAWLLGAEGAFKGLFRPHRHSLAPFYRGRAGALVIVALVTLTFADVVTLVAGFFVSATEVAVVGVAVKLAALVGFVTQASQQFVMRDLTAAIARGTKRDVEILLLRTNLLSLLVMAIALAGAAAFGDWALGLFGEGYSLGYWPLLLFLVSQTLRAASGMNVHLLSLKGHQFHAALACALFMVAVVAGTALFAPAYGIDGIAVAVVLADALWAVALAVLARRYAGHGADIAAFMLGRG